MDSTNDFHADLPCRFATEPTDSVAAHDAEQDGGVGVAEVTWSSDCANASGRELFSAARS
jgi:2-keto-3-deoxy-6-phosphogluconate aldolase